MPYNHGWLLFSPVRQGLTVQPWNMVCVTCTRLALNLQRCTVSHSTCSFSCLVHLDQGNALILPPSRFFIEMVWRDLGAWQLIKANAEFLSVLRELRWAFCQGPSQCALSSTLLDRRNMDLMPCNGGGGQLLSPGVRVSVFCSLGISETAILSSWQDSSQGINAQV